MFINVLGATVFLALSTISIRHGIGLLLFLMVIHGAVVDFLGESSIHLPLYCTLAIMFVAITRGAWKTINVKYLAIFLALIGFMVISSLVGLDPANSIDYLFLYSKAFVLAILVAGTIRSLTDYKIVSLYCIAGGLVGATLALYQYRTGVFYISSIYENRAAGLRGDPNDTAMLLVTSIPLVVYWAIAARSTLIKILFFIGVVLLIVGLALTASRGGFIALLVITITFLFWYPRMSNFAGATALLILGLIMAPQIFWDRLESVWTGDIQHGAASFQGRLELLTDGATIVVTHPSLGVGLGNFPIARQRIKDQFANSALGPTKSYVVAHNLYLEFFAEVGLPGGLLFLLLLFFSLKGFRKLDDTDQQHKEFNIGSAFALSLLGMLFAGLFLSQGKSSVLWFIVGLGLGAWGLLRRENKKYF